VSLFPASVEVLIDQFARLPGVGRKSAARLAFFMLSEPLEHSRAFAQALLAAREGTVFCHECQNLSDGEVCPICGCNERDHSTICVVAEPRDLAAIESCREYKGLYHVLHGVISPTKHKSPDDIRLPELLRRVSAYPQAGKENTAEVILATNPDTDGDTTALYIARLLRPYPVKVTRLAYGLPMGGHVEHADQATIMRAIDGRLEL